jgi:hypothetical protein
MYANKRLCFIPFLELENGHPEFVSKNMLMFLNGADF